ncbi:MAG: hypothetical protein U0838_11285 [Chloroflexota bacterium]
MAEASAVRLAQDHWMREIRIKVGQGLFGMAVRARPSLPGTTRRIPAFRTLSRPTPPSPARPVSAPSWWRCSAANDEVSGRWASTTAAWTRSRPQQVALVRAHCDHAALEIANWRLISQLDEARVGLKRQADRRARAARARDADLGRGRHAELPGYVVKEAARLTGGDGGRVDILDMAGKVPPGVYATDCETEVGDHWPQDPDDNVEVGVVQRAIPTVALAAGDDYLEDPSFVHRPSPDGFVRSMGIRAVMAVPPSVTTADRGADRAVAAPGVRRGRRLAAPDDRGAGGGGPGAGAADRRAGPQPRGPRPARCGGAGAVPTPRAPLDDLAGPGRRAR